MIFYVLNIIHNTYNNMTNKQTMTNQIMKAVEDATSSLFNLFNEIDDLEKQKAICVSQIQDQEQLINELKIGITESSTTIIQHQQTIDTLNQEIKDLTEYNSTNTQQLIDTKELMFGQQSLIDELTKLHNDANEQVFNKDNQLNDLKKIIEDLNLQIKTAQDNNQHLNNKLSDATNIIQQIYELVAPI